jgi:hypothetical protein
VQGKSGGKVHGYSAFAHSAFSAYHGNLVLNLFHSVPKNFLLFQHSLPKCFSWIRVFCCAHKNTMCAEILMFKAY